MQTTWTIKQSDKMISKDELKSSAGNTELHAGSLRKEVHKVLVMFEAEDGIWQNQAEVAKTEIKVA